jgi:hypothetical protein
MSPAVGFMIAKTFFLAKIIHRISTRNLRQEKSLHENLFAYRTFSALRQPGGRHFGNVGYGAADASQPLRVSRASTAATASRRETTEVSTTRSASAGSS